MRPERVVAGCFVASTVASVALVVVYLSGGRRDLEGILLAVALGGLGAGISLWATRLIDAPQEEEEREPLEDAEEGERQPATEDVTRRTLLGSLAAAAGTVLAGALAIPALSLGPQPGRSLFRTRWAAGLRVVDSNGRPLRPGDLPVEGVATVFPQGWVHSADSQAVLVKVSEVLLELPDGREGWAPEGCLAYSKICTHAGCPVGLYRADAHELLCPCHQSTFDVLRGAEPVLGPAARPLPQLPLDVDEEGYLVARGDFSEPAGPSFWNISGGAS